MKTLSNACIYLIVVDMDHVFKVQSQFYSRELISFLRASPSLLPSWRRSHRVPHPKQIERINQVHMEYMNRAGNTINGSDAVQMSEIVINIVYIFTIVIDDQRQRAHEAYLLGW